MKNLVFLVTMLMLTVKSHSQVGKVFPAIDGTLLNEQSIHLPMQNDKYSIIAIAYHKDAEDFLKQWLNPLYENFIKKETTGTGFDLGEVNDVNFVFIPMISGFKRIAENFKKDTDKEFWPYILDTEKTDIKQVQKFLEVKDNTLPYFYVLDKSGKVLVVESGKFTNQKLNHLDEVIE